MPARPKRVSAVSYAEPSEGSVSVSEQEDVEDGQDELESEGEGEEDAEGEEEDVEDQMDLDPDPEGEEEEDAEGEDEDEDVPAPQPVKIRFKVNPSSSLSAMGSSSSSGPTGSGLGMGTAGPSSRLKRTGSGVVPTKGKHARIALPSTVYGHLTTESPPAEAEDPYSDDFDEEDQDRNRSNSPSKLTARQRAKGNKDLQETLVSLPEAGSKKPVVLTEAERLQRREESARRRKRQTEQRLQDEQDQTINRLLRAQTSKSRSKLDAPQTDSPAPEPNSNPIPNQEGVEGEETSDQAQGGGGRRVMPIKEGMVRYVSRLEGDKLVNLIGVVEGREDWITVG